MRSSSHILCSTLLLFLTFTWLPLTYALYESEAGVIDWHKPLTGVPLIHSHSVLPSLHRFVPDRQNKPRTTSSVLLSPTASNSLAAVDAASGNISWKYIFDSDDLIASYSAFGDAVAVLSGPGGSTIRTFDVASGALIAEKRLHAPPSGTLFEPADVGVHLTFSKLADFESATKEVIDVFTLTNGHTVRRVDVASGTVKWDWAAPDKASSVVYSRITRTHDTLYVVGLTKSIASYSLHVTALSSATGVELAAAHIPSSIYNGLTDFLVLSDNTSDEPYVVWLENSGKATKSKDSQESGKEVRFARLSQEMKGQPKALKGALFKSLLNVGLNERGMFVALQTDGSGMALKLDRDSQGLGLVWEFEESASSGHHSESLYAGGLDKDEQPYIGRVFWSNVLKSASAHIYAPHTANGKGLVRGYTFPFDSSHHGVITHVALDAAKLSDNTVIGRLALTTSTGAVQVWEHDRVIWTREEALSEIEKAILVELPERQAVVSANVDGNEGFSSRVARQALDAKDFPHYVLTFLKRFATGSYDSPTSLSSMAPVQLSNTTSVSPQLFRDTFGLRKLIVAATRRGVLFGIDSASGAIVWKQILGLGWAAKVGARHIPLKMYEISGPEETPRVVVVTQRMADNGLVDTVLFHVDALTGNDAQGKSAVGDVLEGLDIVQGEILDGFQLPGENRTVMLLDKFLQVYLFPQADETAYSFASVASKLYFPLLAPGRVLGHQIDPAPSFTGKHVAYPTYTAVLPPGTRVIRSFHRPTGEVVASYGKVLGDRTTLYKYLNPNVVGYITARDAHPSDEKTGPECGIYLIDAAKGTVLYHSTLPALRDGCASVQAAMTENWLVYTYWDGEIVSGAQAKAQKIVSVELYEGNGVNDKTRSSEGSIYSHRSSDLTVIEQAFVYPHTITAMAISTTKFGMASKDLIVTNSKGHVQTIQRRLLDPRRPKRKPTSEELEEWLIQYDPVIPDDPRRTISHRYRLHNTMTILTSPSLLESTSLVFSYGPADLFATRIAPSGRFDVLSDKFNKMQLVLTILGLSTAIIITRPIVKKKRLREAWCY